MTEKEQHNDDFRDSLPTIDEKGKRKWIYPKKPKGKWFNKRKWVSYTLLIVLFGAPFVKVNGNPLFMFNIIERKFSLLGQMFFPQDFYLFALIMLTGLIGIVMFTLVFGRLFCGWVCPQTIFMEMLFRRIEYWIEGDANHQQKLNKGEWTTEKIWKKTLKHTLFYGISFLIANVFLAYIIGIDTLFEIITDPPGQHVGGLLSIGIFSLVFYGVFAFMREQICTTVCPYGRLQGVLLDRNSMVVTYDYVRGENRGKFRKSENRAEVAKGDCIDCAQCVKVCPTGIDIRNGTQLECVNCTACIDECDTIMSSVGLEPGLIRYASEESIKTGEKFVFSTKAKAYSLVLGLMTIVVILILFMRSPLDITALRVRGTDFSRMSDGRISNLYDLGITNRTGEDKALQFRALTTGTEMVMIGKDWVLEKDKVLKGKFMLIMDKSAFDSDKVEVTIGVFSAGQQIDEFEVEFIGPML